MSLSFKTSGVNYMLVNIVLHLHLLCFSTSVENSHFLLQERNMTQIFIVGQDVSAFPRQAFFCFVLFSFFGTSDFFFNDSKSLAAPLVAKIRV